MAEVSKGLTVIVIPQPTVNGPLHIGHLSGPYLAADVASRAARARGDRVFTLAGLDVHPNYVLTKAENLGMDVDEMVDMYAGQIRTAFELARIGADAFIDPREKEFERAVVSMLTDMVDTGALPMREMTLHQCADCGRTLHHSYVVGKCPRCGGDSNGLSCEPCGTFTPSQVLIDPRCARCGGAPQPMVVTIPVLPLEDYRQRLLAEWMQAELPIRVRAVLEQYQDTPLPDYPMAYPTNYGIECDGPLAGLRVDFPAELGFSYLYGPAHALRPEASRLAEWIDAWHDIDGVWHFNGIDNAFFFAILYPAILAAAGVERHTMLGATVNELYQLEGRKFSTSRNHALWADEYLATEDIELVRLFLSWDRPDRHETNFTDEGFRAFSEYVRPLLDGKPPTSGALPAALAGAELERADRSLQLTGFDAALATRCLLGALTTGAGLDSVALRALAGR
ncbi:MAG TPA: class I tRNA ligase family protein [Micromonosporaceae bacterium]